YIRPRNTGDFMCIFREVAAISAWGSVKLGRPLRVKGFTQEQDPRIIAAGAKLHMPISCGPQLGCSAALQPESFY
ncbi:MAG: hypothetical protein MUC50_03085, partial [Myxococcota bacterium]|nr:hypothetical protein [Myxococcota bacterium]